MRMQPTRPLLRLTLPLRIFAIIASAFLPGIAATVEVSDDSLSDSPSQNMISKTRILSFLDISKKMIGQTCAPLKILLMRSFGIRIDTTINWKRSSKNAVEAARLFLIRLINFSPKDWPAGFDTRINLEDPLQKVIGTKCAPSLLRIRIKLATNWESLELSEWFGAACAPSKSNE